MTACEHTRRALQRLLIEGDGAAHAVAARWSHLSTCSSCQTDYDNALTALRTARGLTQEQNLSEELAINSARVMTALHVHSPAKVTPLWQQPIAWLASATSLAAAAALLLWIVNVPAQPNTPDAEGLALGELAARGAAVSFAVRPLCRIEQLDGTARVFDLAVSAHQNTEFCPPAGQLLFAYQADRAGQLEVVELDAGNAVLWRPVTDTGSISLLATHTLQPLPLVVPVTDSNRSRTFLFLFGSHEISADDLRRLGSVQAAQELAKQQDVELRVIELAGSSQENDR